MPEGAAPRSLYSRDVRARLTRYAVYGWGVGELWTSDEAVLAHEFDFTDVAGARFAAATAPDEASGARPPEGAASPPTGTVPTRSRRVGHASVPSSRQSADARDLDPDELVARLGAYLAGADVRFDDVPLDLDGATPFQRAVATAIRRVPRGEVVSYAELAALAGHPRAQRAVGTFCARNRFMFLLPCHRVVATDGIGGYGIAGTAVKRRLLALEDLHL
jgi:methylated-DNA-[protein]-cysteine S-methyltransferase